MLEGELERFIGYTFSPETQPKLALNFRNKGMENVNNKKKSIVHFRCSYIIQIWSLSKPL